MPGAAAIALNLNSLLWPGASVPASKTRLLLPSLDKPLGSVSVTFTPVNWLLPEFLTTKVIGIGSQTVTSFGSVLLN